MAHILLVVPDADRRQRYGGWLAGASPPHDVHEARAIGEVQAPGGAELHGVLLATTACPSGVPAALRALRERIGDEAPIAMLATSDDEDRLDETSLLVEDLLLTEMLTPVRLRRAVARLADLYELRHRLHEERRQRQELEDELARVRHAAETLQEEHRRFIADKTHDLRSPLNAILGYSEMLKEELEDREDASLVDDVKRIHRVGRRLLDVVGELAGDAPPPTAFASSAPPAQEPETASGTASEADEEAMRTLLAPSGDGGDGLPANLRSILLIDDDPDLRDLMARYLETEGYDVTTASDGQEGLQQAHADPPACITLDVHMPGMDGWAVLEALKEDASLAHIPVLMLTGRGNERVAARALRQGVDDYLIKGDITALTLRRALDGVLEKARLRFAVEQAQHALIQANETLEERVKAQTDQIRALASSLTLAEQRERQRVAQILHDHLQQHLYSLNLRVQLLSRKITEDTDGSVREQFDYMRRMISEAIGMTRTLSVELSPPALQNEDLLAVLEWLAMQVHEVHDLRVHVDAATACQVPGHEMRVLIYQLVRELLFNVVKHAGVDEAHVTLRKDEDYLCVEVRDEGAGFDVARQHAEQRTQGGWGLGSMEERLSLFRGRLDIDSAPGRGTRMTLMVPREMLDSTFQTNAQAVSVS